jgi:hypothetical protein
MYAIRPTHYISLDVTNQIIIGEECRLCSSSTNYLQGDETFLGSQQLLSHRVELHILSQINPFHTLPSYFFMISFSIVFPLRLIFSLVSPLSFPTKIVYAFLILLTRMTWLPYPPGFVHSNIFLWRVHVIKFLIVKFYIASCYFIPLRSNTIL